MVPKRWPRFVGWDGILPLLVTMSLDGLRLALGRVDALADFLAVVFVPMFAALARCSFGMKQLAEMDVTASWRRQTILAAAIIVLMIFEGTSNALRCNGVPLPVLIPVATALYASYLALIWLTFRAPRSIGMSVGEHSDAT